MSSIADVQARVAFQALRRVRGVEVEYLPRDGARAFPRTLVPGQADDELFGDDDASAYTRDWLDLGDELRARLGRAPTQDDRVRVVATGEVYTLAPMDSARVWRPAGPHGGVVRIRSLLTEEGARP